MRQLADPDTVTALIVACYGEGEPTDNAKRFMSELDEEKSSFSLAGSRASFFSVFGLGNSHCFHERFNVVGKLLDNTLRKMGGISVLPLGVGDASENINASFSSWKKEFLSALKAIDCTHPRDSAPAGGETASSQPVKAASSEEKTTRAAAAAPDRAGEAASAINQFRNSSLVPLALSPRQTSMAPANRPIIIAQAEETHQLFDATDEFSSAVHVTFDLRRSRTLTPSCGALTGSAFTEGLQAGDHIGVFAPNSTHVVERFAVSADLSAGALDTVMTELGTSATLRQILTWQLQLTSVVPLTTLKVLHRWARDEQMKATSAQLERLIAGYDTLVIGGKGYDVSAVLDMIPVGPHFATKPLTAILKTLPALSPRLYSFTHNPLTQRESATLLCRLLRYRDSSDKIVDGLCSSYLNERLDRETAIFFRESNFHLPKDPKTPVVMIAGGTGISPFISFLEERSRVCSIVGAHEMGPAVLYYGCRNPDEYMFRRELLEFLNTKDGAVLSRLVVAFSTTTPTSTNNNHSSSSLLSGHEREEIRPSLENIPHSVLTQRGALDPLMRRGAHVYVCGGAGNYGKAVRNAVNELALPLVAATSSSTGGGGPFAGVKLLVEQNRFFEDLAD